MKKIFVLALFLVLITHLRAIPPADTLPPGWEYSQTPNAHNLFIPSAINPAFGNEPLQTGDFIGVFYLNDDLMTACGGAVQWQGENAQLTAFGNDAFTPEKDGFKTGDRFIWKIFRQQNQQEYFGRVEFDTVFPQADGKFYPYGLSQLLSFEADVSITQTMDISNGWSGKSLFIEPHIGELEVVFAGLSDSFFMMSDGEKHFYPAFNIKTLDYWDIMKGYQIKALDDILMEIEGFEPRSTNHLLTAGWNIMPVISPCQVEIEVLFAGSTINLLKEVAGDKVFWPHFNIADLTLLEPGKAYQVWVDDDETISFPTCEKFSVNHKQAKKSRSDVPWNEVTYTPNSHVFAFPGEALSNSGLQPGDIIGAFDGDGLCVGTSLVNDPELGFALSAFENDTTTAVIDGFQEGENASFKMYRSSQQTGGNLDVSFDPLFPQQGNFAPNGVSAIASLIVTSFTTNLQENGLFEVFPNPNQGQFIIQGQDASDGLEIRLFNSAGKNVELTTNTGFNGRTIVRMARSGAGVYFLKITDNEVVEVKKVVIYQK
jgi:membrane-associated protease RseP (regulator of RpoE activity)